MQWELLMGPKYLHHAIYSERLSAAQICLGEGRRGFRLMVLISTSWLSRQAG
jgi:hypothetical protein